MTQRAHGPEIQGDSQTALISLLKDLGVDRVSHSGQTLMSHLVATSKILEEWGCRPALCEAGLFHSIYGTEMFRVATQSLEDRRLLQEMISVEAETLAYLYGTINRQSLYSAAQGSGDPVVQDFRTGRDISITREQLSDLFTLDLANTLEHGPRVYLRPQFMDLYRRGAALLPASALAALDQWAEARQHQSLLGRQIPRIRFYLVWFWMWIHRNHRTRASSGNHS